MTTHISQLPEFTWFFALVLGAVFLMIIVKLIFPGKRGTTGSDDSWANSDQPIDIPNDTMDTASNQQQDY
jgi:hypothetical protein